MAGKFDTIVLDPSIRLQRGFDENAAEIQELHNAVDDVAGKANVGLTVVGHMRKSTNESVTDQSSSRGHSSTTDGARIVIQMAGMSLAEAKLLLKGREQDRVCYVKLGDPKQSYAANSRIVWLEKVPVRLPIKLENGNPDSRFVLVPAALAPVVQLTDEQTRQVLQRIKDGYDLGKHYTSAGDGKTESRADAMVRDLLGVSLGDAQRALRALVARGQVALVTPPPNPKTPKRVLPDLYVFKSWEPVEQEEFAQDDDE
jgi:hypothetical protein